MREPVDIEILLDEGGFLFEQLGDSIWKVTVPSDGVDNIIVDLEESILLLRLKLMDIPPDVDPELFRKVLQMNATEILHGAFALDDEALVLIDTLETENLDLNELSASLQSLSSVARSSYRELKDFLEKGPSTLN